MTLGPCGPALWSRRGVVEIRFAIGAVEVAVRSERQPREPLREPAGVESGPDAYAPMRPPPHSIQ
jgi:hypothetical protein